MMILHSVSRPLQQRAGFTALTLRILQLQALILRVYYNHRFIGIFAMLRNNLHKSTYNTRSFLKGYCVSEILREKRYLEDLLLAKANEDYKTKCLKVLHSTEHSFWNMICS